MSWTRTLVVTLPPASRQTRAAAQRKTSAAQHPCQWTRCTVVAMRVTP